MNETIKMMMERKSVRAYEDRPVPADVKDAVINAAMRAPTAGNMMLWSVIDVTEQSLKDSLAQSCDNQPFISTAPMVLLFLADYRRWFRKFKQAGRTVPEPRFSDLMLSMSDAMIAAHTACLAAESLGLGSCYIGDIIEQWETNKEVFSLPPYTAPAALLVFGYPTQQQKDRTLTSRFPKEMIVFENRYHDLTEAELSSYATDERAARLCDVKYMSDFALEMERSAKEIMKNWMGK